MNSRELLNSRTDSLQVASRLSCTLHSTVVQRSIVWTAGERISLASNCLVRFSGTQCRSFFLNEVLQFKYKNECIIICTVRLVSTEKMSLVEPDRYFSVWFPFIYFDQNWVKCSCVWHLSIFKVYLHNNNIINTKLDHVHNVTVI